MPMRGPKVSVENNEQSILVDNGMNVDAATYI